MVIDERRPVVMPQAFGGLRVRLDHISLDGLPDERRQRCRSEGLCLKVHVGCWPRDQLSCVRNAIFNLWRIPLQLSLAATALFGITLIPDILDKLGVIHIPSWLTMGYE